MASLNLDFLPPHKFNSQFVISLLAFKCREAGNVMLWRCRRISVTLPFFPPGNTSALPGNCRPAGSLKIRYFSKNKEDARDKKSQWEPLVFAIVVIFFIIVLSSYSPLALDSCFFCLLLMRSEASWTGLFSTFGLTSFPSSISQKHICQDGGING